MKFPKVLPLLACVPITGTALMGQQLVLCTPTKNQVILRQRMAEIDAAAGRLNADALRLEVQQLHREKKINDEQLAGFMKIIHEAQAPKGPADTAQGRADAQRALQQKLTELEKAEAPAPVNTEAQAKAQKSLEAKMLELQAAESKPAIVPPDEAARRSAAEAALAAKMQELAVSQAASTTAPSDSQLKAQQALVAKMAELDKPAGPVAVAAPTTDRQAAAQKALEAKIAELNSTPTTPVAVVSAPQPKPAEPARPVQPAQPAQPSRPVQPGQPTQPTQPAQPAVAVTPAQPGTPAKPLPTTPEVPASVKVGLERLKELTELYRAGRITPGQYHAERAKIVNSLPQ